MSHRRRHVPGCPMLTPGRIRMHYRRWVAVGTFRDLIAAHVCAQKMGRRVEWWDAKPQDVHFPVAEWVGLKRRPDRFIHGAGLWRVGKKWAVVAPCIPGVAGCTHGFFGPSVSRQWFRRATRVE